MLPYQYKIYSEISAAHFMLTVCLGLMKSDGTITGLSDKTDIIPSDQPWFIIYRRLMNGLDLGLIYATDGRQYKSVTKIEQLWSLGISTRPTEGDFIKNHEIWPYSQQYKMGSLVTKHRHQSKLSIRRIKRDIKNQLDEAIRLYLIETGTI